MTSPETPDERDARVRHEEALRQEGARVERESLAGAASSLTEAAAVIARRADELENSARAQVLGLVRAIVHEVLRREVEAGRYDLEAIVRDCLRIARGVERGAVVHLNPRDHAAWTSTERNAAFTDVKVEWKADAAVSPGSCRLETPYGDVMREISLVAADVFAAVEGRR